ncbi:IS30 family transposase [Caulobacter vibrioides]|jgi:IS30 family transposase|uniref:IS30 family, transposase n=3 Tax=Caulobacter TaxID=75 RepID=Q9A7G2_CAUVC|nr:MULTISPECIES: IS30 family transposase [Caulobacter]YP_002517210.1 transposase, IS30 family [Caulobacter vibrioides NA1000]MBJ7442469.1 IS30 family transposase [Sphingopyxis sp.]AAK23737.1 IS30 family, transposase [Caulobacter vibrioides CB15]ACL95302.1 transposase, IS30 family [Caulobacter vibrioides NA1000]ATC28639.1 IS30 family transposase [Caulobacter vibrioides]AZH12896.1 IS30 family transposase [Caulobacter vibrioides]|tara:strand:+ start:68 stop:1096 length:1029 start_codon:yes stop_codon:yes gene_type:complete
MGSRYDHITLQERHQIARWRDAKVSVRVISERLGRHPSTIHREIRRNWFDDGPWLRGYFAVAANERASTRRRRVGKLHRDPELARFVTERLQETWSPEQIAGHLKSTRQLQAYACHETIYRYVYGPDGRAAELYKLLPRMRRRRRARYARRPRGLHIPPHNTIAQRPAHIGERQSYGHWECDLIAFRKEYGRHNITTLVERRSRYLIMIKNPSRSSTGIMAGLAERLEPFPPPMRQSITFDRGTEFAFFATLKRSLEIDSYFCKPQAPWQKGTVENTNGRLRRFLPSDTDIALVPPEKLLELSTRLNRIPRKCLGYRTPEDVLAEQIAVTAGTRATNGLCAV